jgi:hypothetical protein
VRRQKGGAERIKHAGTVLLLVKVCGSHVRKFIVREGDIEGGYKKVESLAGCLLIHGPKGCELRLAVEP